MFYVGQRVVCIKEGRWKGLFPLLGSRPVKGAVYTVREKLSEPGSGDLFLGFDETGEFPVFWSVHFRPVIKTDISVFKRMLAPNPREVEHVGS